MTLQVVAFASGKGGVGKTALAANFSWSCSRVVKTLLVDLDFHNQGATSLFARHFTFASAQGGLALGNGGLPRPTTVAEGLDFLPAGDCGTGPPVLEHSDDLRARLVEFVNSLVAAGGYELVVLDCHGGIEPLSLAASMCASTTFVVTETDSVTFGGTLELLRYYAVGKGERRAASIRFIVNRIPSKYSWDDLARIYERQIRRGALLREVVEVASFIPADSEFGATFGECPFFVELAPRTILAKKIFLLAYEFVVVSRQESQTPIPQPLPFQLAPFARENVRKKVRRIVMSDIERYRQGIVRAYAATVTAYTAFILVAIPVAVFVAVGETGIAGISNAAKVTLGIVASVGFLPVLWLSYKSLFQLAFYYRDKYHFEKALVLSTGEPIAPAQRISLAASWLLRIGTAVVPWFGVVYIGILALGLLAGGLAKAFAP